MMGFAAGWIFRTVVFWIGIGFLADEGPHEDNTWGAEKRAVSAGLLALFVGVSFGWESRQAAGLAVSVVLLVVSSRQSQFFWQSAAFFWLLYLLAAFWFGIAGETLLRLADGWLPIPFAELVGENFWIYIFGLLLLETVAGVCFWLLGRGVQVLCARASQWLLALLGAVGFAGLLQRDLSGAERHMSGASLRMFFAAFAGLFFLLTVQALIRERKIRRELRDKRLADQAKHYQEAAAFYQAHARLYHDRENQLNLLYQILNDGDTESAKRYIEKISRPVAEPLGRIYTGNVWIDAVLGSKAAVMEKKGIPYNFQTEFPKPCGVDPDILCLILGNLLDNAVEAVEAIPEEERRPVRLTLRKVRGFLILKQENPYRETDRRRKSGEIHGWGLSNVDHLVAKAGGTTEYRREKGKFISCVLLLWKG